MAAEQFAVRCTITPEAWKFAGNWRSTIELTLRRSLERAGATINFTVLEPEHIGTFVDADGFVVPEHWEVWATAYRETGNVTALGCAGQAHQDEEAMSAGGEA